MSNRQTIEDKKCSSCIMSKLTDKPCEPDQRGYCDLWVEKQPEEEVKPESCDKCKYYFDCRKGSIANAYGGLECAEKWNNQQSTSEGIREAFEKDCNRVDIFAKSEKELLYEKYFNIERLSNRIKELEQQRNEVLSEYREIDNLNTDLRIELQKTKQQIEDMKYKEEFH